MFSFNSIMSRIVIMHVVAVIVAAILLRFALYRFLDSDVEQLQQSAMRTQAEALERHLTLGPGGWSLDLPAGVRDQYSEAYGRYKYAVLDDTRTVIFSSLADRRQLFRISDDQRVTDYFESPTPGGEQSISGVSIRSVLSGRTVWIQVAEDLSHRDVLVDDITANFFQQGVWFIGPVFVLLLFADIVIFRVAVKRLHRASDLARDISPTRIDVRFPTKDIPTEIMPLVKAVNQALDRIERGYRSQRDFTADAAHELRTPLAILRTRIETLPENSQARALVRDVESMSRVISQLLDAAELETTVIDPEETVDLHEVCIEVAEYIAPLALKQQKTIELTGADEAVYVRANAEMIRRAIRNLAENALNHTPEQTIVEIAVHSDGVVSVIDQGQGVRRVDQEHIYKRFWRQDRRAGAGLGLSIVKRIVEAHDGTITLENRPSGGAKFSIRLPLATPNRPV